ncbi:MAG: type IV secretion system DNA-binding domain-containing protein [Desulfonauticus sp.]|nr:type IV secretion system DNA-binding domain-containing protein [Desulfonauticus sp.]
MNNKVKTYEGFEVWTHAVQMRVKMLLILFVLTISLSIAIYVPFFGLAKKNRDGWYVSFYHYLGCLYCAFSMRTYPVPIAIHSSDGRTIPEINADTACHYPVVVNYVRAFLIQQGWIFLKILAGVTAIMIFLTVKIFRKRAKKLREEELKRGLRLATPKEIEEKLKKDKPYLLPISQKIHIPQKHVCKHVFVMGATGSGKSTLLCQQIAIAREKGVKNVIMDPKGEFVSKFFVKDQDIIFNPFDRRGKIWDIMKDIKGEVSARAFAASFISPPPSAGDAMFFYQAARALLTGILVVAQNIEEVVEYIYTSTPSLAEFLARNQEKAAREAAIYLGDGTSKQALGVHATLMETAYALRYLSKKKKKETFTIKDFIQTEKGSLFLSLIPKYAKICQPLYAGFINLLCLQLLSLADTKEIRCLLFMDEFASLPKLEMIPRLLREARSKGVGVILAMQDFSEIDKRYGRTARSTFFGNCFTRIILRLSDPDTTQWISQAMGEAEIEEATDSFLLGVEDHRDGLSISRRSQVKQVLLPSELTALEDLALIARIGHLPPFRDKVAKKFYDPIQDSFQEKRMEGDGDKPEGKESIKKVEKETPAEQSEEQQTVQPEPETKAICQKKEQPRADEGESVETEKEEKVIMFD